MKKKNILKKFFGGKKNRKGVGAYVFTPFARKPLNKIWCNQLPSEVT
jgi:hypothetical protein